MTENDPARMAELESLGGKDDEASRQTLLNLVLDQNAGAWERVLAVKALAQSKAGGSALLKSAEEERLPAEMRASATFACASSPVAEVRGEGAKVLPVPRTKDGKAVPPPQQLAELRGDAKAGGQVFRDPKSGQCTACHQLGNEGQPLGPPLTKIGDKFTRRQLYESILTPNASIAKGYEQWVVKTKAGQVFTGLIAEETKEQLRIKDSKAEYHDVPAADVARKMRQRMGMMADNAVNLMTLQELVDLVEFLAEQKEK